MYRCTWMYYVIKTKELRICLTPIISHKTFIIKYLFKNQGVLEKRGIIIYFISRDINII